MPALNTAATTLAATLVISFVTKYQHSTRARDTTATIETIQAAVARQDTQNRMSASARVSVLVIDAQLDRYIQDGANVNCDHGLSFWLEHETHIHCWPLLQKTWCQLHLHKPTWSVFSHRVAICAHKNVTKHVLAQKAVSFWRWTENFCRNKLLTFIWLSRYSRLSILILAIP